MIVESAVSELTVVVGTSSACAAVGRPRATHYRRLRPPAPKPKREPTPQPRALTEVERSEALKLLHSERFVDAAPPTVYATLLDEGRYLASISTFIASFMQPTRSGSAGGSPPTLHTSSPS